MRINKISIAIIVVIIIILGIFFMQKSSEEVSKIDYKLNETQIDVNETSEVNVIKKETESKFESKSESKELNEELNEEINEELNKELNEESKNELTQEDLDKKETERLLGILSLPPVIKEHTEKITKIDDDFYHVLTKAGKKYMFRPSSEEIVDISNGLVMVDANENEYYFLNGIHLPFEDYVEYKVKEERRKMLNKNVEGMPQKVWVCDISEKDFLVVVGTEPNINYADYYYFDEQLKKIRFREIYESEKEEYKDIKCE